MAEPLPVAVAVEGPAFDAEAVRHTLRHLALVMGWRLVPEAPRRIVHCTADAPPPAAARRPGDVTVLSSSAVARHLETGAAPLPLAASADGEPLPFPHPAAERGDPTVVAADVVAGAHAVMNLWYERRTRAPGGPVVFADDWWTRAGFDAPAPVADRWLARIAEAARAAGWPGSALVVRSPAGGDGGTVVLSHDVDYLPGPRDRGLPRLVRALVRHAVYRRRPGDALRVAAAYGEALFRRTPYLELPGIRAEEARRGVRSSFQFTVARRLRVDPAYRLDRPRLRDAVAALRDDGFEVGLHGSYGADGTPGRLAEERAALESLLGTGVTGHRQHYLSFHPATLFRELEAAGIGYDSSVGYNEIGGPRSGTLFPYRPYDLERRRPHRLWEIPLILMDTTLALPLRLGAREAGDRLRAAAGDVVRAGGAAAVVWHQEQLGGLLDPGYDRAWYDWLDEARAGGVRLAPGGALVETLDAAWRATADPE